MVNPFIRECILLAKITVIIKYIKLEFNMLFYANFHLFRNAILTLKRQYLCQYRTKNKVLYYQNLS